MPARESLSSFEMMKLEVPSLFQRVHKQKPVLPYSTKIELIHTLCVHEPVREFVESQVGENFCDIVRQTPFSLLAVMTADEWKETGLPEQLATWIVSNMKPEAADEEADKSPVCQPVQNDVGANALLMELVKQGQIQMAAVMAMLSDTKEEYRREIGDLKEQLATRRVGEDAAKIALKFTPESLLPKLKPDDVPVAVWLKGWKESMEGMRAKEEDVVTVWNLHGHTRLGFHKGALTTWQTMTFSDRPTTIEGIVDWVMAATGQDKVDLFHCHGHPRMDIGPHCTPLFRARMDSLHFFRARTVTQ
jgi:hypothetical protein